MPTPMTHVLTLPWPVMKELSPNWRGHWSGKARAKKKLRHEWAMQARAQGLRRIEAAGLHAQIEFHQPDKRARDIDNLLASIKAGIDGLADVIGIDDSRWTLGIAKSAQTGGFVRITFSTTNPNGSI